MLLLQSKVFQLVPLYLLRYLRSRLLLSHSSGMCYDLMDPLLLKWRTNRNEIPGPAATIEERCNGPLLFEPGTSWMYGMGTDWAGKMVECAAGETLETYMSKNIWAPLHHENITFWPAEKSHMHDRIADLSTLKATGKAVPLEGWDRVNESANCLVAEECLHRHRTSWL